MKSNNVKKFIIGLAIAIVVIVSLLFTKNCNNVNDKDIVILFTNDIHCNIEENIGMAGLIKYYKELDNKNVYKALVDAGDFSQGNEIGSLSKGELMYQIMDKLKYDFIVPGNHEFDYGMDRLLENSTILNGIMYCCNLIDLRTNETVYAPYKIMKFGNKKVGFIGISTPLTVSITATSYYKNDNGEYIYSFMQGDDGKNFYNIIQKNIDEVKKKGADYVILVAHCGESKEKSPYDVPNILKNVEGVNAVIDGHTHHIYNEILKDKKGKDVFCAETGMEMENFGELVISKNGKIDINLINEIDGQDDEVVQYLKEVKDKLALMLDEVVCKDNKVLLELEGGFTKEIKLGDFIADAFKYVGKTDVAIVNVGAIRDDIKEGDISYSDLIKVFPFNNYLVCAKVKGSDLFDALELSSRFTPKENPAFLQVSGIEFTIDTTKPSNIVVDNEMCFVKVDGDYRVQDVKINGEPLDLEKEYNLASNTFILKKYGDGYKMFENAKVYFDDVILDIDLLTSYLKECDMSQYKNNDGKERIHIISK